jgi:cation diffusion facilitator CzcD-associated flavoprotein CzcO
MPGSRLEKEAAVAAGPPRRQWPREVRVSQEHSAPADAGRRRVIIQGAGLSGLAMGIALLRQGIDDFLILEKSPRAGGTWWDNRYPGAQCDVPSHLYSFSFAPNPDWSRVYAPSAEIQAYAERCIEKYGLASRLRLATPVVSARFADGEWQLASGTGECFRALHYVASTGPLNEPAYPGGLGEYRGRVLHTARWDPEFDARGLRVAVIGSAASAVQVIPPLAARAAQLTVFQRSPSWILPRPDRAYGAIERALARFPPYARVHRLALYWLHEAYYAAFKGHGFMHRYLRWRAALLRRRQLKDPQLRRRVTPGYPAGCKRILISSNYYPALARANVELAGAAARFTRTGVVTADGTERACDVIVCATGFTTQTPLAGTAIFGRGGQSLGARWRRGPEAYRGVAVAGFPNFFLLLGPNTGSAHTSVLIAIEAQARYIARAIRALGPNGTLEVRAAAEARDNARLGRRLAKSVWSSSSCSSWYKTADGRVNALYPGHSSRYVLEMLRLRRDDYLWSAP